MKFVDPRWLNLVVCIGFIAVLNSQSGTVAALIKSTMTERTGYSLASFCGLMVSDRAALSVAEVAGMDEKEACVMRDGDKVGGAATGKLIRSVGGVVVNPFPAGRATMGRAQKMVTFFSYGPRRGDLKNIPKQGTCQGLQRAEPMNNGGGWLGLGRGSGTGDSGERDDRGLGPTGPLKSLKFQFW